MLTVPVLKSSDSMVASVRCKAKVSPLPLAPATNDVWAYPPTPKSYFARPTVPANHFVRFAPEDVPYGKKRALYSPA